VSKIEKFGKYILLEKIATGGMAEIYLAKAPGASGINKYLAIKRILPQYSENPEFIEMFKAEAKIAINLAHSNIVSIYEFGVEKGQFFLVMDYVEGKNLRQIINRIKHKREALHIDQILYIIREVAAGLDSAHRCLDGTTGRPLNITHRDMSPQNIMLSFEGEVKIVDFGIAKAESQIESTKVGTLKGKFGYMSPEQAEGIAVDLRTDVFSLGIVMWELLANDRLFIANNEMNTLRKIRDCQIPSLRKINPKIPEEIEKICNKILTRDRNMRYQTAAALHRDVSTFLNKHYPSFSPHDFSDFTKTLFADEILEVKKKIVDFAHLTMGGVSQFRKDAGHEPTVMYDKKAEITLTPTPTQTDGSDSRSEKQGASSTTTPTSTGENSGDSLEEAFKNMLVTSVYQNTKKSKRNRKPDEKKSNEKQTDFKNLKLDMSGSHKSIPIRNSNKHTVYASSMPQLFLSVIGVAAALLALVNTDINQIQKFVGSIFLTQNDEPSRPPVNDSTNIPTNEAQVKFTVSVYSTPPQAQIFIDGKETGFSTPSSIRLDSMKAHEISLKLPGYFIYRTEYFADKSVDRLDASLQKTSEAFLNINVFPNTAIVYINGQRIPEKLPIKSYAIPANKEIIVRAEDPITQTQASQVVFVEENKVKRIDLFLNKAQPNIK